MMLNGQNPNTGLANPPKHNRITGNVVTGSVHGYGDHDKVARTNVLTNNNC
jgi:hypothetical protein